MNVIGILVVLSIFTVILGTYRATTNAGSSLDFQLWNRTGLKSPRLHFVSKEVSVSSQGSKPHPIVLHLQRMGTSYDRADDSPQALGLSLSELEKCIPWIPMDNTIFVSSDEGFAPTMLNRIKRFNTTRDLYLIDAKASEARSTKAVEA